MRIKIQSLNTALANQARYQLREFEKSHLEDKDIDLFVYDYSKCPTLKNPTILSDYYYYSDNYLNIPTEKVCFNFVDTPLTIYCHRFIIPLNFLVELILLNKGYSFIHSAAVNYNGKNYLFPAFGGIGKTTTIASLVFDGGKLFGDDLNIIKNQDILNYPLDFSVYPYHFDALKIKDKKLKYQFKKTKILDSITARLIKYNFRIIKLVLLILRSFKTPYANIPPKKIFGENYAIENGQIDKIYYLVRKENNLSKITMERIDANRLAEICTNILLQEWHGSMSILYTYSGLTTFSLHSIFEKIRDIFKETLGHYECQQVTIPKGLDNLTYQKQLISLLK